MYQLQNTLLPEMDSMLEALDICSELDWWVLTISKSKHIESYWNRIRF